MVFLKLVLDFMDSYFQMLLLIFFLLWLKQTFNSTLHTNYIKSTTGEETHWLLCLFAELGSWLLSLKLGIVLTSSDFNRWLLRCDHWLLFKITFRNWSILWIFWNKWFSSASEILPSIFMPSSISLLFWFWEFVNVRMKCCNTKKGPKGRNVT